MKATAFFILITALSLTTARASSLLTNLVVNPGAEAGFDGWSVSGATRVIAYTQSGTGHPTVSSPGPEDRGLSFFEGGVGGFSSISQMIDLSFLNWEGSNTFEFIISGWMGGWANQSDRAEIAISFFSINSASLGTFTLGPVTAADRGEETGLWYRELVSELPAGSAFAAFMVNFTRGQGDTNDGYADNFSFIIIPEPSTTALLIGALASATLTLRKRRINGSACSG
jgi:hypothetical protein